MLRKSSITLTTDFGEQDSFVAEMKGVILSCFPDAKIIDVSHQIPAFDIEKAARIINQVSKMFPKGTIHIVVVDPGVGGERKAMILKARDQFFIGPDNGVFSLVWNEEKGGKAYEIKTHRKYISRTFHGRDVFAPAAAELAMVGESKYNFGSPLHSIEILADKKVKKKPGKKWVGCIIDIDKFGNLATNIPGKVLKNIEKPRLLVGDNSIDRFINTFNDGNINRPGIVINSEGYLEIIFKNGSAFEKMRLRKNTPVMLSEAKGCKKNKNC